MLLEFIDNSKLETTNLRVTNEPKPEPAPSLTLRVQPWLKLSIGFLCLMQGLHLLLTTDPLGTLLGLVLLLISVPSCFYLGWRDYRELEQGRLTPLTEQ
jgi:hypothetical protein